MTVPPLKQFFPWIEGNWKPTEMVNMFGPFEIRAYEVCCVNKGFAWKVVHNRGGTEEMMIDHHGKNLPTLEDAMKAGERAVQSFADSWNSNKQEG